jgi:hypothetical protein
MHSVISNSATFLPSFMSAITESGYTDIQTATSRITQSDFLNQFSLTQHWQQQSLSIYLHVRNVFLLVCCFSVGGRRQGSNVISLHTGTVRSQRRISLVSSLEKISSNLWN